MLGLRLVFSRCGGRLRLVGMELRGMVWIGLVNSGYSRKEGELTLSILKGVEEYSLKGRFEENLL